MQPLNPNSLYECVRLEECTLPNLTKLTLYRKGRLLVDLNVETEDCSEHHMHCPKENLPQFPVCHSLFYKMDY